MSAIRTCERCKALELSGGVASCSLGFTVVQLQVVGKTIEAGKVRPSGKDGRCPKPTTNADLVWWAKQRKAKSHV